MGVIDRINDWALRRLGRGAEVKEVAVGESGIRLRQNGKDVEVSWNDVRRAVAFQRPTLAGDEISLLLELDHERVVELNPRWAGWFVLVSSLDFHLPGARPYVAWLPDLASAGPDRTLTVFSRQAPLGPAKPP